MASNIKLNRKTYSFDGGINTFDSPNDISDNQLQAGNNVIFNNGNLTTRCGISPISEYRFGKYSASGNLIKSLTVTDTFFTYNGSLCKVAYDVWSDSVNFSDINIYLIFSNSTKKSLGKITVNKISGVFYPFQSVFFTVGKPTSGSGLYAFIRCSQNSESYNSGALKIYECSSNFSTFSELNENNFYAPTAFINGTGNNYKTAKKNGVVFDTSKKFPETDNMLTGKFKAYFSTDGYSSQFKLPFWKLNAQKPSVIRFYANTGSYAEWNLPANTQTATVNFNGAQVTATLNCTSGCVRFSSGNTDYAMPRANNTSANNLVVFASKVAPNDFATIVSSENSFAFGDSTFLYGNKVNKNEVYGFNPNNPLYFPKTEKCSVGNYKTDVLSLKSINNNLYAFKEDGIYKVAVTKNIQTNNFSLPNGDPDKKSYTAKLSCDTVSEEMGCLAKNSIKNCKNAILFLANDKKVYSLSGNSGLGEVSLPVNKELESISVAAANKAFCIKNNSSYMLFFENKCFLFDYKDYSFGSSNGKGEHIKWYKQTYPEGHIYEGGFEFGGVPYLVCSDTQKKVCYAYKFTGEYDEIADYYADEFTKIKKEIDFCFETKNYDFDNPLLKKDVKSFDMFVSGYGTFKIIISADGFVSEHNIVIKSSDNIIKILPLMPLLYNINLKISGKSPFKISKTQFNYLVK